VDSKKTQDNFHVELVYSTKTIMEVRYWRSGKGLILVTFVLSIICHCWRFSYILPIQTFIL